MPFNGQELKTMNGTMLAQKVIETYHTNDIYLLVERAGVRVIYDRWHPATYGEFDRKKKTISININAPITTTEILVHELGHYFAQEEDPHLEKDLHEKVAKEFALAIISQKPFP